MQNKVELIGHYGSDEVIACSAWTSTSRNLTENKRNRIGKLINMLWSEGHETPFEKGVVHFLVDTDIASHIHLLKHRISSLNAESARYKELKEDKYYLPEDWEGIKLSKDFHFDGDYFDVRIAEGQLHLDVLEECSQLLNKLYHATIPDVEARHGRKRAKESGRFYKMYNSQIQADVMFNMRSFANFVKLRNSEHAQLEIREIAQQMWDLVATIEGEPFKHTLDAIWRRINE